MASRDVQTRSQSQSPLLTRPALAYLGFFAVVVLVVFAWAKWVPYWHKVPGVADSGTMGPPVIGGESLPWFSLSGGWDFTIGYLASVWPAIVAGLVTAAGVQTLVPPDLLARFVNGRGGVVRSAFAGVPTMLCTCCAAPIAVGLRKRQVPVRSALAFWLANPLLNPVVIAFAVFALSPGWAALRLALGAAVLIAVLLLIRSRDTGTDTGPVPTDAAATVSTSGQSPTWITFLRALAQLSVRLVPVYVVIVFVLGALRGTLLPLGGQLAAWGILGVLVVAIAGTLIAVPTGAEIAVVAALLAAGVPAWIAAPLLITLPATSLPSLAMAWRSFPRRVEITIAGVTLVGGLLAAAAGALFFA